LQFSGQLVCSDLTGQKWIFYFAQGRIIYATGGVHLVRRWRRNLATYCRYIPTYRLAWQSGLAQVDAAALVFGWEHALLDLWVKQQKINRDQASAVIHSALTEILFDLLQTAEVKTQIYPNQLQASPQDLVEIEAAIDIAEQRWLVWKNARLGDYSPNQAPLIKDLEKFQRQSSAQLYQRLSRLLNGQHTLYDLATEMQHDVVNVAASLRMYLELGWLELLNIPDLPAPVHRRSLPGTVDSSLTVSNAPTPPPRLPPAASTPPQKAVIACVDDSPLVRHMMEELLISAGYQFVGIEDAVRAIGILLSRKPDVIFLDLMMPDINGYELCEQLRKLSCFRETPIVILTSNDGFASRLRSKIVNASDFLSKPLNAEAVLSVIDKYLNQSVAPVHAD
jgi:chemotaxis family two-component system response regulator PixG